jgi:hypothetical protein
MSSKQTATGLVVSLPSWQEREDKMSAMAAISESVDTDSVVSVQDNFAVRNELSMWSRTSQKVEDTVFYYGPTMADGGSAWVVSCIVGCSNE